MQRKNPPKPKPTPQPLTPYQQRQFQMAQMLYLEAMNRGAYRH